jgi:hypothetical protein
MGPEKRPCLITLANFSVVSNWEANFWVARYMIG